MDTIFETTQGDRTIAYSKSYRRYLPNIIHVSLYIYIYSNMQGSFTYAVYQQFLVLHE